MSDKNSIIPYSRQSISNEDIQAVIDVLKSDFLTQGPVVPLFEKKVAEYCSIPYAVAASNATACLHMACHALGVGPSDVVWTSPNTFVASANCALYCGAKVDFVDIDPKTYNLCPNKLEEKLRNTKDLPKVVIPVHFSGQSCDMAAIHALSQKYGFKIIEDASHCIGGSYRGKKIGNCDYSDITVFSFHPVKIITTGEGGICMTKEAFLAEKLNHFRTHGITRDKKFMEGKSEGSWYYQQIGLGYNYRITDMQCALGLSQLNRLDDFIDRRREKAVYYNQAFGRNALPFAIPYENIPGESAWHLYVIRLDPKKITKDRKDVFDALKKNGIGVNVHYIPVHLQPFYKKFGFRRGDFPVAEAYYENALSLPLFPNLKQKQQDYVIERLETVLNEQL